jgi:hypothetical protein
VKVQFIVINPYQKGSFHPHQSVLLLGNGPGVHCLKDHLQIESLHLTDRRRKKRMEKLKDEAIYNLLSLLKSLVNRY